MFTRQIGDAVATTGTHPQLHTQFLDFQRLGATDAEIRDGWVKWGRKQFPQRLLNTVCLVITNATYGEATPYQTVLNTCAKGGSHNSMYSLLKHFSELCREAGWAPYGVNITDQAGDTPSGYLPWYDKRVGPVPQVEPDRKLFLQALKAKCFTAVPPSGHEVALKVADYVHRNNL